MLEKIKKAIFDIANWICIVALFLIIIVLMIVVVGRYFFNLTPSWSEELSLFLLVWVGLFSACIAEYHHSHVRLSFIDNMFPPKLLKVFAIIRYFLKLVFFSLMTYYGFKIFMTTKQRFGAIDLSFRWEVLPGLLTGVFCLIFLILDTKRIFTDRYEHDGEKKLEILKDE